MSNSCEITSIDDNSSLYKILKNCADFQSHDNLLLFDDFNDVYCEYDTRENCSKMISVNQYSVSGNISNCSYTSDDLFDENILEENGRISLAYENLKTIPRKIAEKFAMHTQFLDLSYNNFQNLSFLSFFNDLHTLILDRNMRLDVKTLPFLPNLKILWINNCDIENIAEWIMRIRIQCPALKYLSIMGNREIKQSLNFDSLNMVNKSSISIDRDYKEYVLKMLPKLQYIDGIHRDNLSGLLQCSTNGALNSSSSSASPSNSVTNSISPQSHKSNGNSSRKSTPALSFKGLFSLKRRKKSYPGSSST